MGHFCKCLSVGAGGTSACVVGGTGASQPVSPGLPSQKPKEQQRSVLRPAVLQAPQPKALSQTGESQPGARLAQGGTISGGFGTSAERRGNKTSVPDEPSRHVVPLSLAAVPRLPRAESHPGHETQPCASLRLEE